jgi:Na+/melibiose symporter and related transporters
LDWLYGAILKDRDRKLAVFIRCAVVHRHAAIIERKYLKEEFYLMQSETKQIPKSLPWMFFTYSIAVSCNTVVTQTYLMFFITEYTGLSATVMASILTVARFVDLGVSLFSGMVVQKSNTKMGAFRPWLLFCPLITWGGCIVSFLNPNIPLAAKLVITVIGYLMTHLPMNFITVAQNGIQTAISGTDMDARLNIASKRIQGMQFARIVTALTTLPFINFFFKLDMPGYLIVILIHGAIAAAGTIMMFIITKEYDKYVPNLKNIEGSTSNVKISQMYIQTLKNSQMWVLLIVDTLKMTGLQGAAAMMTYYLSYSAKNFDLMTVAQTVAGVVGFGAAILATPIAKKLGKKPANLLSCGIAAVSYLCLALFTDGNPILYIALTSIATVGLAVYAAFGVNPYLDAAEYQLYKTGQDNRPFVMSMQNITIKIAFIASGPITAIILNATGYDPVAKIVENTKQMVFMIGMIPTVAYILAMVIFGLFYKITDEKAAEYAQHNKKMMEERAAASAANKA